MSKALLEVTYYFNAANKSFEFEDESRTQLEELQRGPVILPGAPDNAFILQRVRFLPFVLQRCFHDQLWIEEVAGEKRMWHSI